MADDVFSSEDTLGDEVQSCKISTPQQTSRLKYIQNLALTICCPYSKEIDGLDQSLYLIFYLMAIVLTFMVLFITKELSLEDEDNEKTSHFVQEDHIKILLVSYMTPAILWTICLFLIKNDAHILVFDNNSLRYGQALFCFIYLFGCALLITNILQATLQMRCGETGTIRSLYLCVETLFVLTQMFFQVLFLNASFLAKSVAKLAVIHMIGSNISVFIHGMFTRTSQEMHPTNHTINRNDTLASSYCNQTKHALRKIVSDLQPINSQFFVITLVTLAYIFNNIKQSHNEIHRDSPTAKMLRRKQRRNVSMDTTLDKSASGFNSTVSSILPKDTKINPRVNLGVLTSVFLTLLLVLVSQLVTKSGNWSELIMAHDICYVIIVSTMLYSNWLIAWALHNYHPLYDRIAFTPTEIVLLVSTIGSYAWTVLKSILIHMTRDFSLWFLFKAILTLLLAFVQTFVIAAKIAGDSPCLHGNNTRRKHFVERLAFLVVCNAAMALNEIFFAAQGNSDFETVFNKPTWMVRLTSFTHSLHILYFFYSSICFLDIFFKYRKIVVI